MGVRLVNINNQNGSILGAKIGFGSKPKVYFQMIESASFWMTEDQYYSSNDIVVFNNDLWYWMNEDNSERW